MQDIIEHPSGLVLSAKTFRPLWIFPWTCSIWRQFPLRTAIATVAFQNKPAAEVGHRELVALLQNLKIGPKMSELFPAIEAYAKDKAGNGVKSHRIYPGHEIEGKVTVKISPQRTEQ